MAQATSDEDYDAKEEKKSKRKKVHHAARTQQRRQKRKQEQAGKEQERQAKRKIINNASRNRQRQEMRKQEQEEKEQEKTKQQDIRKFEEAFWNNPDLNMRKLDLSTHEPPDWWVLNHTQNVNAATYVFYAMMPPPEDTRRPPHLELPAGYAVPIRQTCEPCAMYKLSVILERLRTNPEYVSLDYATKQQDIEIANAK